MVQTALAAAILGSSLLLGGVASAQTSPDAAARADALFEKGKRETSAGHHRAACTAFDESLALDPAEGTLLALALCHEQVGELARAFTELQDARAAATRSNRDDRQRVVRAALARIEPRIGRIVVRIPASDAACAPSLRIDGEAVVVSSTEPERERAVTPGHHRVTCGAAWAADLDVSAGALAVLTVPESARPKAKAPSPPLEPVVAPPPPPVTTSSTGSTLGWVLGGTGVAAIGVGSIFGVRAFSRWSDVESKCTPSACADRSAGDDASSARSAALVANIAMGAGLVLVATGIYFLVASSPRPAAGASVGTR